MNRSQILKSILGFVDRISDEDYQKRVWVRLEGPECDDFDETMTYFFDEIESILKNYKDFGISNEQYQLLVKFHDILDLFSDEMMYFPAEQIILDPRWQEIRELAKEVLQAFNFHKN